MNTRQDVGALQVSTEAAANDVSFGGGHVAVFVTNMGVRAVAVRKGMDASGLCLTMGTASQWLRWGSLQGWRACVELPEVGRMQRAAFGRADTAAAVAVRKVAESTGWRGMGMFDEDSSHALESWSREPCPQLRPQEDPQVWGVFVLGGQSECDGLVKGWVSKGGVEVCWSFPGECSEGAYQQQRVCGQLSPTPHGPERPVPICPLTP